MRSTLAIASAEKERRTSDRALAVTSNNLASALLERPDRTEEQTELMMTAARAARTFWLKAGDWTHDERSDYLLALVHNAVGEHDAALGHVDKALQTIAANGAEPIDAAFLHLARAVALRGLARFEEHAAAVDAAETLARNFTDPGIVEWYRGELAKAR